MLTSVSWAFGAYAIGACLRRKASHATLSGERRSALAEIFSLSWSATELQSAPAPLLAARSICGGVTRAACGSRCWRDIRIRTRRPNLGPKGSKIGTPPFKFWEPTMKTYTPLALVEMRM